MSLQAIYLSIYLVHPFVHPSVRPSVCPSIHPIIFNICIMHISWSFQIHIVHIFFGSSNVIQPSNHIYMLDLSYPSINQIIQPVILNKQGVPIKMLPCLLYCAFDVKIESSFLYHLEIEIHLFVSSIETVLTNIRVSKHKFSKYPISHQLLASRLPP